jgi:hypothetical protein
MVNEYKQKVFIVGDFLIKRRKIAEDIKQRKFTKKDMVSQRW